MTAQTLERNPSGRRDTTPRTPRHDEPERMPLRTDLFVIAHDDNTGQPHLDKQSVAVGLAAAVLLELWYAGRVRLGRHGNPGHGTWRRNHGQITLIDASATGDSINDAALVQLWRMGGTVDTRRFIEHFATTDLYEQVRDHLIAKRILCAFTRRRYWIFRTLAYRPNHPVRARARIRDVARLYRPHPRDTTLAALVTALGLTPYLHLTDHSVTGVHLRLAELVGPEHPLRDVARAIRPHRIRYQ
jgi:hypothetical protein